MKHTVVVDLGYGDAGKGALVDRLCAEGDVGMVVRFNGGCQAAHNVITDSGLHHTFAQFGSGTLQGVGTYLAAPVMVEPLSMLIESGVLERSLGGIDPMRELWLSPDCRVTTPYHWLVNQWEEDQRGDDRHGSCGRGIGTTAKYAIDNPQLAPYVRDFDHEPTLIVKLNALAQWALNMSFGELGPVLPDVEQLLLDYKVWRDRIKLASLWDVREMAEPKRLVFEGAQGVLLDEHAGFHPHTTWSTVTPDWVRDAFEMTEDELEVVGVTRAYMTRHGAGPFVSEDPTLVLPEAHNKTEHFQGGWRVGHLDLVALRYAVAACGGIDSVYVTHIDTAHKEQRLGVCVAYERYGDPQTILHLNRWSLIERAEQTRMLSKMSPVLKRRRQLGWGDTIASLLSVPLYGVGAGPRTSDGAFLRTPEAVTSHA